MLVQFKEVGRGKLSWKAETGELDYDWMFRQVKTAGVMSNGIDFDYDEEKQEGNIFVGGFRKIGTFSVEEKGAWFDNDYSIKRSREIQQIEFLETIK